MSIQIKCVLVEAAHFIGLIKRYHVPLRRAYLIITKELKTQVVSKEIRLQMAVKAINDTAEYNELVSTLLVFDIFPRITNDNAPILLIIKRVKVIDSAMTEVAKLHVSK